MIEISFDEFFALREQAASAYVRGDGSKLDAVVPHKGAASFHSPGGETVTGAAEVAKRYLSDAALFDHSGVSRFEVIQKGQSGDIGFWTGFQVARVRIGDMPKPIDMRIRVTEIFRRTDGAWRLVHRHADMPGA
jgi:ketosteroid isomerase-like protein